MEIIPSVSWVSFRMTIPTISKLKEVWSPEYIVQGSPWKFCIEKTLCDDGKHALGINVYCSKKDELMDWSYAAAASFKILTFDGSRTEIDQQICPFVFDQHEAGFGNNHAITWDDLFNAGKQCVKDDTVTLELEIDVKNPSEEMNSKLAFDRLSDTKFRLIVTNINNLMATRAPPFMLRKTPFNFVVYQSHKPYLGLYLYQRDAVNDLFMKVTMSIKVPLSTSQKAKYKDMVDIHSSENGIVRATNEHSGMSIMMDMRKLSNHPLLMRYYYNDKKVYDIAKRLSTHPLYKKNSNPQYIFEELAILSDFQLYQIIEKYHIGGMDIPDNLILDSGKFLELDRLLPKLKDEGHRVLIFSQFTMMLDVQERYLDIREHGYLRIDGQTLVTDRQDLIDQYMGDLDMFVFLLSTKAGGVGINLTAADTAEDRCHRMGQTRPVTIYRLVSEGTIEEGMLHVAMEKLNLEKEVTNENENSVKEHKCMVRLLTMALGMDEDKADIILSPTKTVQSAGGI